jgi:hypothetical protein
MVEKINSRFFNSTAVYKKIIELIEKLNELENKIEDIEKFIKTEDDGK